MQALTIEFKFSKPNGGNEVTDTADFDVELAYGALISEIDEKAEELLDALNDDLDDEDDEYELDGYAVIDWDDDYANPANFSDLDEYAGYAELCDKHGEAFHLRWDDVGELSSKRFDESYRGCYSSLEEYAEQFYNECYDVPDHLANYIDWERVARDLTMDCSVYEGNDGYHVFIDY